MTKTSISYFHISFQFFWLCVCKKHAFRVSLRAVAHVPLNKNTFRGLDQWLGVVGWPNIDQSKLASEFRLMQRVISPAQKKVRQKVSWYETVSQ